jgi:hypothetical protein
MGDRLWTALANTLAPPFLPITHNPSAAITVQFRERSGGAAAYDGMLPLACNVKRMDRDATTGAQRRRRERRAHGDHERSEPKEKSVVVRRRTRSRDDAVTPQHEIPGSLP